MNTKQTKTAMALTAIVAALGLFGVTTTQHAQAMCWGGCGFGDRDFDDFGGFHHSFFFHPFFGHHFFWHPWFHHWW